MQQIVSTYINTALIDTNSGQIPGLPANARTIDRHDYKRLLYSINTHRKMLQYRELLVFFVDGRYVCVCGNMVLRACRDLKIQQIPCKIIPSNTPIEELRAIALLSNASFGEWQYDELVNNWQLEINDLDNYGIQPYIKHL